MRPSPQDPRISDLATLPDLLVDDTAFRIARRDRTVALFIDYDGTLTPIVDRPELAVLPERARTALDRLSREIPVALVSGRDRRDIERLVGLPQLVMAGSHGFDLSGPGWTHRHAAGERAVDALVSATEELERSLGDIDGLFLEPKAFALAVHVRRVAPEHHERVAQAVAAAAASRPELRRTGGKALLELRPAADWHKGRAVAYLGDRLGLDPASIASVYIGDDETDEDALAEVYAEGIGIAVGDEARPTFARMRLRDTDAVAEFLERLPALLTP